MMRYVTGACLSSRTIYSVQGVKTLIRAQNVIKGIIWQLIRIKGLSVRCVRMGLGSHAIGAQILGFALIVRLYRVAALVTMMAVCNARLECIYSSKMVKGLNAQNVAISAWNVSMITIKIYLFVASVIMRIFSNPFLINVRLIVETPSI